MRGVNKVILVGTLGRDPETKQFTNGGSLTHFSMATSEAWKDKSTGENVERTEWHNITLANRLGEIAQQYLRKGSKVYIEGSIQTRKWQDQNGIERYTTEIRANSMQMLDTARQDQGSNSQGQQNNGYGTPTQGYGNNNGYGNQNNQQSQGNKQEQQRPQPPTPNAVPPDLDDDLPF